MQYISNVCVCYNNFNERKEKQQKNPKPFMQKYKRYSNSTATLASTYDIFSHVVFASHKTFPISCTAQKIVFPALSPMYACLLAYTLPTYLLAYSPHIHEQNDENCFTHCQPSSKW